MWLRLGRTALSAVLEPPRDPADCATITATAFKPTVGVQGIYGLVVEHDGCHTRCIHRHGRRWGASHLGRLSRRCTRDLRC